MVHRLLALMLAAVFAALPLSVHSTAAQTSSQSDDWRNGRVTHLDEYGEPWPEFGVLARMAGHIFVSEQRQYMLTFDMLVRGSTVAPGTYNNGAIISLYGRSFQQGGPDRFSKEAKALTFIKNTKAFGFYRHFACYIYVGTGAPPEQCQERFDPGGPQPKGDVITITDVSVTIRYAPGHRHLEEKYTLRPDETVFYTATQSDGKLVSEVFVPLFMITDPEVGEFADAVLAQAFFNPLAAASNRANLQRKARTTAPPLRQERPNLANTARPAASSPVVAQAPALSLPQPGVEVDVTQATGPRVALIIGNASYGSAMGSLKNPVNDANLIGTTLRRLGFDVEVVTDANQREMKRAVQRFGERLIDAGDNATGLFFFAGHGVQSKGVNYLIPVSSRIEAESDLDLEAVSARAVLSQMEEAYVSTRIVILDACRNMPLRRRTRDGARGLARMEAPNGSYIAYSTSPGSTAADGGGLNSPFATALVRQMVVPKQPIEVMFREVRKNVVSMTDGDQVPWVASSLLDTFSFTPSD